MSATYVKSKLWMVKIDLSDIGHFRIQVVANTAEHAAEVARCYDKCEDVLSVEYIKDTMVSKRIM